MGIFRAILQFICQSGWCIAFRQHVSPSDSAAPLSWRRDVGCRVASRWNYAVGSWESFTAARSKSKPYPGKTRTRGADLSYFVWVGYHLLAEPTCQLLSPWESLEPAIKSHLQTSTCWANICLKIGSSKSLNPLVNHHLPGINLGKFTIFWPEWIGIDHRYPHIA